MARTAVPNLPSITACDGGIKRVESLIPVVILFAAGWLTWRGIINPL